MAKIKNDKVYVGEKFLFQAHEGFTLLAREYVPARNGGWVPKGEQTLARVEPGGMIHVWDTNKKDRKMVWYDGKIFVIQGDELTRVQHLLVQQVN